MLLIPVRSTARCRPAVGNLPERNTPNKGVPTMQETEFEIDRDAVWKYFLVTGVLGWYGVREPEKIRELILSKRKSTYGEKSEDA
jgi:hypothetical protein